MRSSTQKSRGANSSWLVVGGTAVVIGVVVVLVVFSSPSPSPPPPTMDVTNDTICDWCGQAATRAGSLVKNSGAANQAGADSSQVAVRSSDSKAATLASAECIVLRNEHFTDGSYIMNVPDTCYVLGEDIVFRPAHEHDFRAKREPYASMPAFVLDFFAAIVVSAPGVSIDLNGHEIKQSVEHYLQQRFFAVIELASSPFIKGQGPADFIGEGGVLIGAAQFTLRNGRIGLSSHHGIHGNAGWSMLIEDVEIYDYEVAAIHLNGAHDTLIRRVKALGSATRIPVLGTYSTARFIFPFVQRMLSVAHGESAEKSNLIHASGKLLVLMNQVLTDVVATGQINPETHPEAFSLFGNPSGRQDCSAAYGIILHNKGVAVHGMECDINDERNDALHHVIIEDCEVHNTHLEPREVIALRGVQSGTPQRGPAGAIVQIQHIVDPSTGRYAGTALSDVEVALGALARKIGIGKLGTLNLHPKFLDWAINKNTDLADLVKEGVFDYFRNGDVMAHVNKGVFGIRISGGHHIAVRRTVVSGTENFGLPGHIVPQPGETPESAYYINGNDGGHPLQNPQSGYMGADAFGVAIDASDKVILDTVTVRNTASKYMWAGGVVIMNGARNVRVHDVMIFNVSAAVGSDIRPQGPKFPRAVAVCSAGQANSPDFTGSLEIADVSSSEIGLACEVLHEASTINGCSPGDVNFYGM